MAGAGAASVEAAPSVEAAGADSVDAAGAELFVDAAGALCSVCVAGAEVTPSFVGAVDEKYQMPRAARAATKIPKIQAPVEEPESVAAT